MKRKNINIFGGGCAGFSFVRRSSEVKNASFSFYSGSIIENQDHYWGFWKDDISKDFDKICLKWYRWKVINNTNEKTFHSSKHPYCLINKSKWIKFCSSKINKSKVKLIKKNVNEIDSNYFANEKKIEGDYFFDSRRVELTKDNLLQHFLGLRIKTIETKFDPSTIILMDFRCDQSKGLHFIYLIPFSENEALVESTIFSKNVENKNFYIGAINSYLKKNFKIDSFRILKEEKGVIPMYYINIQKDNSISIGTRGGATRPSSGYTFIYIQQQINNIIYQLNNNSKINNIIHNKFILFMDKVFIKALEINPKIFPDVFYKMTKRLSGDEMALFMNGKPQAKTWIKIIYSLPKILFLFSILLSFRRN